MAKNDDDYRKGLDRLFQEMEDRKQIANEQELRERIRKLGGTDKAIDQLVQWVEELARADHGIKTQAQAHAWACAFLSRALDLKLPVLGKDSR